MKTKQGLYGLIGYPLGHSFSPRFFAEKFEREGLGACSYELFPLASVEQLPELWRREPRLCGLNVTTPYKEAVLPYLQSLSPEAEAIGAVNCLKPLASGGWQGHNSDAEGFARAFADFCKEIDYQKPNKAKALLIGRGGAALAVAYSLRQMGWELQFLSRRAKNLQLPEVLSYEELQSLAPYQLIVQASPLGMWPKTQALPSLPYQTLRAGQLAFDLVYNPEETSFLKRCKEAGLHCQGGLSMLYAQAEAAWEYWQKDE